MAEPDLSTDASPRGRLLLPVDQIHVGERFRAAYPERVDEIAASMAAFGQRAPIIVGPLMRSGKYRGKHRLAAGLHRLRAAEQLGWTEIWADVEEEGGDWLRLLELAENLHRAELAPLDRAVFTAEFKRLYEAVFPHVRHGGKLQAIDSVHVGHDDQLWENPNTEGDHGAAEDQIATTQAQDSAHPDQGGADTDRPPAGGHAPSNITALFPRTTGQRATAALAEHLRLSESSIRRDLRLGQKICPAVRKLLTGTPLAHQRAALTKLAKLQDADTQQRAARAMLDGADANTAIARAQGHTDHQIRQAAERRAQRRAPATPDALDLADLILGLPAPARLALLIEIQRRGVTRDLEVPVHLEIELPTH
jgi:hypothetical protein